MSTVYLYALLRTAPRSAGRGMVREPLRAMRCGNLIAMVGAMKSRPDVDATRLKRHDAVVRRLAAAVPAILPARFGGFVEEKELRDLLQRRENDFLSALTLVKDREQMILRLSGDVPAPPPGGRGPGGGPAPAGIRSRAEALATEASRATTSTLSSTTGSSYLRARRAALAAAESAPELDPVRAALAASLRGERIRRHDRAPLIATAYHLIDRGSAARYRTLVRRAARASNLRIRITGPFPPYAFAPEGIA